MADLDEYAKYYQLLGRNLAYFRKKRRLTQEGLALKANVSRAYISHIESKNVEAEPSLHVLFHICSILRIEPYQLFLEREDTK